MKKNKKFRKVKVKTPHLSHKGTSSDEKESGKVENPFRPIIEVEPVYIRTATPPPSSHSSHCDDFDPSSYASTRNDLILKDQSELKDLAHHRFMEEFSRNGHFDAQVTFYKEDNTRLDSDSGNSNFYYIDIRKFKNTMSQILQNALEQGNLLLESVPIAGGIHFCYIRFQRVLQIKWIIISLRRCEEILGGRGDLIEIFPTELEDYEAQFESIYGPMDNASESYQKLLFGFKADRLKIYIDMLEREKAILEVMIESGRWISEWEPLARETKETRLQLEQKLMTTYEANLDLNPYSSGTGLDFFVLPRLFHPTTVYQVRPQEFEKLVEFSQGDGDGVYSVEGYNAALCDVGCTHIEKIIGERKYQPFIRRRTARICAQLDWINTLQNLKSHLQTIPVGVEVKTLFQRAYERYDDDGADVLRISDLFFTQRLGRGKNKRIIVFPSVFEGLIITPREIILRIWKRIKYYLFHHKSTKVGDLEENYQKFFHQPLYPINWGFSGAEEFIKYSYKHFSEELAPVKCIQEHEVDAVTVEEQEDDEEWEDIPDEDDENGDLDLVGINGDDYLPQNYWNISKEVLTPTHVFKVDGPLPFDMM